MSKPSWRTCVFALDVDSSPHSAVLFSEVLSMVQSGSGSGGGVTPREKGRYKLLSKEDLLVYAKSHGLKSPSAALKSLIEEDKNKGVIDKERSSSVDNTHKDSSDSKKDEKDDEDMDDEMLAKKLADEEKKRQRQEEFDKTISSLDVVKEAPDRVYILSNWPKTGEEGTAMYRSRSSH